MIENFNLFFKKGNPLNVSDVGTDFNTIFSGQHQVQILSVHINESSSSGDPCKQKTGG